MSKWMLWEGTPAEENVAQLRALGLASNVLDPCANRPETGDFLSVMSDNAKKPGTGLYSRVPANRMLSRADVETVAFFFTYNSDQAEPADHPPATMLASRCRTGTGSVEAVGFPILQLCHRR